MERRIGTMEDLGELFSVSPKTARRWVRDGLVEGYRLGHRYYVDLNQVEQALKEKPATNQVG